MSQLTSMTRTQYSNEGKEGNGRSSQSKFKPRRNSTHDLFGPQVTYQLWKGMENMGPGPGKYMGPSDFGQVETTYNATIPDKVDVRLSAGYAQPLKRNR